ncbi:hypothetical protein HOLleu_03930 [Holothuria leucospilota]|uniref:Uncharacterized protein n=1 Tax=Holothuria leucospilota TaxID=206669 RepID=A0A9Q1CT76_HOLLE|nr:hypothetical protein HOLleu_03930 [Holothuria leucospilota]
MNYYRRKQFQKTFGNKILRSAGLGSKTVIMDSSLSAGVLREQLFNEFPKLAQAGGFEYLRTTGHSKELEVISLPPGGRYSTANMKAIVPQAKIYLRLIQCELYITGEAEDDCVEDDTLQVYVTDYINLLEPVDLDEDDELKHVIEVSLSETDKAFAVLKNNGVEVKEIEMLQPLAARNTYDLKFRSDAARIQGVSRLKGLEGLTVTP